MVEALRSGEELAPADRSQLIMWLETLASSLEHMDALVSAMEAKVITREHLAELEEWVGKLKMDHELQQMGFDPAPPAKPEWLKGGETVL